MTEENKIQNPPLLSFLFPSLLALLTVTLRIVKKQLPFKNSSEQ